MVAEGLDEKVEVTSVYVIKSPGYRFIFGHSSSQRGDEGFF